MQPALTLDSYGERVLSAWWHNASTTDTDRALVREVLTAYAGRQAVTDRWYCAHDIPTGDLIVQPRDGLCIVIRPHSDDEPRGSFSLTTILPGEPDW